MILLTIAICLAACVSVYDEPTIPRTITITITSVVAIISLGICTHRFCNNILVEQTSIRNNKALICSTSCKYVCRDDLKNLYIIVDLPDRKDVMVRTHDISAIHEGQRLLILVPDASTHKDDAIIQNGVPQERT